MTFTQEMLMRLVAAGVLLITVYLQSHVHSYFFYKGQLTIPVFIKSTCHCNNLLYYLCVCVILLSSMRFILHYLSGNYIE